MKRSSNKIGTLASIALVVLSGSATFASGWWLGKPSATSTEFIPFTSIPYNEWSRTIDQYFNIVENCVKKVDRNCKIPYGFESEVARMTALANTGKGDAVMWMLRFQPDVAAESDYAMLRKAAESGHPKSMYLYSQVLRNRKDKEDSMVWVERAAAEGYPDAVMLVMGREQLAKERAETAAQTDYCKGMADKNGSDFYTCFKQQTDLAIAQMEAQEATQVKPSK